jgi:hypothetical protein
MPGVEVNLKKYVKLTLSVVLLVADRMAKVLAVVVMAVGVMAVVVMA